MTMTSSPSSDVTHQYSIQVPRGGGIDFNRLNALNPKKGHNNNNNNNNNKNNKNDDDGNDSDDDDDGDRPDDRHLTTNSHNSQDAMMIVPLIQTILPWKQLLGASIFALYALNQSHLLPRPLSGLVSRALFWPTLPITYIRRRCCQSGSWTTIMDDTVILGGAPVWGIVTNRLYHDQHVRGVINLCEEYRGPPYHRHLPHDMQQLWLPTTDHFEPTVEQLLQAVHFIETYASRHERVYVHCRAGHGRSAAVVMAWEIYKQIMLSHQKGTPSSSSSSSTSSSTSSGIVAVDLQSINEEMCRKRNVRKGLWKQPNINTFHQELLKAQHQRHDDDDDNDNDDTPLVITKDDDNHSERHMEGDTGEARREEDDDDNL